jgi:YD repeat-containing protein
MTKRFLTLTLLFTLLLASTPSTPTIKASPLDGQKSSDAQHKAEVERTLQEAGKSATYDQTGRVTKLTLPVSDNKNVSLGLTYDEQGRIQYIVHEDGTKMRLVYDNTGQWRSVIFPDGGRVTLEKDQAGNVVGFRTERPVSRKTSQLKGIGAHGAQLRKASVVVPSPCEEATQKATVAVIAMGAACLPDPVSIACAAASANAAYLTYVAYQACKSGEVAFEESAA